MKRTTDVSPPRGGSATSSKPVGKRGAVRVLPAFAVAFALALPAFASASPLGEVTFYDEGIRSTAEIAYTTEGPDGNVWFVDNASLSSNVSGLGQITPAGAITEYMCGETLSGCNAEARLIGITAAPEGDTHLWFTDRGTPPAIGRIDSASPGTVEEFSIEAEGGNAGSEPQGIVADSEGKLWFTDHGTIPAIGVFDPSAPEGERVEEFSAGLQKGSRPRGIVVGSDGALWFTDTGGWPPAIGRIDPDTHAIEEFSLNFFSIPGGNPFGTGKSGIVAGPDGNIWFTETKGGARGICRIEVAEPHEVKCLSDGLVTPKAEYGSKPRGLTVADGNLWFTDDSDADEKQFFGFGSPEVHWNEGNEFALCNEDESNCATGTYKTDPDENSAQVLDALESIYGAGNVATHGNSELKVTATFVGELAGTNIGQTSCRKVSGNVGCSSSTANDGRPDAIGRINKYDEIARYPINGVNGVNSVTHLSGSGDVWFPATSKGVKSIGKFGIEVAEVPLTVNINEGEGAVVSNPAPLECAGTEGESCEAEFEEGAEVTLTASPAAGYRHYNWQNCDSVDGRQCTVTMSEAKEVDVKFKKTWELTLSKAAGSSPGIIKALPTGVACPFNCLSSTYTFLDGQEVQVDRYEPSTALHFAEFTGGTGSAEACNGKTTFCLITIEEDSSIEALFEENAKATLSLTKEGGGQAKITSTGNKIYCFNTCDSGSGDYYTEPSPEEVTVEWDLGTSTGSKWDLGTGAGASSIEWTTGAGTCTGSSEAEKGSCKVTMDEAHELVAKLE